MVINLFVTPAIAEKSIKQVSYDKFLEYLDNGKVKEVSLESDVIYFSLKGDKRKKSRFVRRGRIRCTGSRKT